MKKCLKNFQKGIDWIKEGNYKKALNVYDTIKDEKARSFYYHILLMTAMQECKEEEFRSACAKAYHSMIFHYTREINY